jgi:preprotein translocase subunit SecG
MTLESIVANQRNVLVSDTHQRINTLKGMQRVMDRLTKWLNRTFLVIAICTLLAACSKVSQDNFEKVKPGMSMKEVVMILGEPTKSESIDIAGVSGTSATWKDRSSEINIHFLSNQVLVKTFDRLGENNKNP